MVSTQNHWRLAIGQRVDDRLCLLGARLGNLLQVARIFLPNGLGLGDRNRDIPTVSNMVTKRFQLRFQAGNPHRRRTHVHTPPRLPQVQRHTNDADLPSRMSLHPSTKTALVLLA